MNNPLVSIILPTYNGSLYIEKAITSCLEQTVENWELIIVDDASTDSTPSIISIYEKSDPRIRIIKHSQNKKLPAALNSGFFSALGDFFTWLSDDNYFSPNAIETMSNYLFSNPAVDLVYTDFFIIDEDNKKIGRYCAEPANNLSVSNVVGASFLYRRILHDALNGYDESLFLAEDYDFWLRAARQFNFSFLENPIFYYRQHRLSLTEQRKKEVFLKREHVLKKNLSYLPWMSSKEYFKSYYSLAQLAFSNDLLFKVPFYLMKAFVSSPLMFCQTFVYEQLKKKVFSLFTVK